jgi:hypothetical protein
MYLYVMQGCSQVPVKRHTNCFCFTFHDHVQGPYVEYKNNFFVAVVGNLQLLKVFYVVRRAINFVS